MSEADRILLVGFGSILINLGLVGLCLKLYTEFIKEKKYRA